MSSNKRLAIVLGVILLLILGLAVFYLYLQGGATEQGEQEHTAEDGLIPIRSIYAFGERNIRLPVGIGADDNGGFFVTLRDSAAVVEFDRNGDYVRHWGERGTQAGQFLVPLGVAVDRLAGHVYVVDRGRLRLICFNDSGEYLWEVPILRPISVTVAADGDVYVTAEGEILRFDSEGQLYVDGSVGTRGKLPGQFDYPRNVAVAEDGSVFVADTNNTRIQRVRMEGQGTAAVDWVRGEPPRFQDDPQVTYIAPSGIALSADERQVVVIDGFGHRIEMLDPATGETLTDFGGERRGGGQGMFNLPTGITHMYDDYYAVTDTYNDRVQIIRLLAPDDRGPFSIYPWLKWLPLLLLLPLLGMLGRKRVFATREALARAVEEGDIRLIAGVFRKIHVLPVVAEEYADVTEGEVRLGDYLVVAEAPKRDDTPSEGADVPDPLAPEERELLEVSRTRGMRRALLPRVRIFCGEAKQLERFTEAGAKVLDYDEVKAEYVVAGEEPAAKT